MSVYIQCNCQTTGHEPGCPNLCTCRDEMTGGKPWCPIHDNYAGIPPDDPEMDVVMADEFFKQKWIAEGRRLERERGVEVEVRSAASLSEEWEYGVVNVPNSFPIGRAILISLEETK